MLKLLCNKISIPVWLTMIAVLPILIYALYLKFSLISEEKTVLELKNEIKTLKFLNTEYESNINKLKINIDVNAVQLYDINRKLSQCYSNLTKLQTGYNEIETIMNEDTDKPCECPENTNTEQNTEIKPISKPKKVKTVSETVNKNGIVFINSNLKEISK